MTLFAINERNWRTTRFSQNDLLAFIALGAVPAENETKIVYTVNVTNSDYEEISEQIFENLDQAIESINQRFAQWELNSLAQKSEGGCDSCAAH